jgi:hypothetical protein
MTKQTFHHSEERFTAKFAINVENGKVLYKAYKTGTAITNGFASAPSVPNKNLPCYNPSMRGNKYGKMLNASCLAIGSQSFKIFISACNNLATSTSFCAIFASAANLFSSQCNACNLFRIDPSHQW